MKIACVILGSRGDVQPMIALATSLNKKGHEATVYAPPEHEEFAKLHDCPFVAFGPDVSKAVKENPEGQKGGKVVMVSLKKGKELIGNQIRLLPELLKGSDLVLGAGIVIGVQSAADALKIPYRLVAFYTALLGTTREDPLPNRILFGFGRKMMSLLLKGFINRQRAYFGLQPIKDIWKQWTGEHIILACDKELTASREGSLFPFTQTGFMLLPDINKLPDQVEEFIDTGMPPVYIGFGSNPITNAHKYVRMFEQVRDLTNRRLIVSKGWSALPCKDSHDILYVDEVPFSILFPRMAAVIYHGGMGTMAAVARAGVPQAAFPFMADQFDNHKQIIKLGLGPKTCYFKQITSEAIASAITDCISNEQYKEKAVEISKKLESVDGIELTIQYIEKEFGK